MKVKSALLAIGLAAVAVGVGCVVKGAGYTSAECYDFGWNDCFNGGSFDASFASSATCRSSYSSGWEDAGCDYYATDYYYDTGYYYGYDDSGYFTDTGYYK
jgi:hypothetical protein